MKNSISPRLTPLPSVQEISENNDKLLRELLKSKINGSFLIKIKSEVLSKLRADTFKYYPLHFDNVRIMTGTDETPEYDILVCGLVVTRHPTFYHIRSGLPLFIFQICSFRVYEFLSI